MREDDLLGLEFWRKQRAMGVVTTAAKGGKGGSSWSSYWTTRHSELATYVSGLTTPLSEAQIIRLGEFIEAIKTGLSITNLSDAFDVMYVLGGETSESSLRNLVKNAHYATAINSPTFTQYEGIKGNGVSQYLDTIWNGRTAGHAVAYSLDSASFGFYRRTTTDKDALELSGAWSTTADGALDNRIQINTPSAEVTYNQYWIALNSPADFVTAYEQISGMIIGSRTANNVQKLYVNKTVKINGSAVTTKIPNQNVMIMALIRNTTISFYDNDQFSFAFLGRGLTETEVGIVTDAFEAYMDANGKGVIA